MRIVLATGNAGKEREFAALMGPLGFELVRQSLLGIEPVEETGQSFEANALLKARHAAAAAGLPALADDSGLEVDALGGRPGVYSARYAGPGSSDAQNNQRLIEELEGMADEQRSARYHCVLALVRSAADSAPLLAHGQWEGRIARHGAGEGGFGYDPYFLPNGLPGTAAQLPAAQKNAVSHRARALTALIAQLAQRPSVAVMPPPLALYLHFPWCVRKCPYCDFNSHTLHGELAAEPYLAALLADLSAQLPWVTGRSVGSVFLGGGTPSLFPPELLARLFAAIHALLPVSAEAEITLEANPGTIERGRFAEYRAAGINRVSLGAQSFSAPILERLGRIHSAADTRMAAEELHAAGLGNFNLDLMYALPEQDLAGALHDVREALALAPRHVSHYQLTLEPGTVFGALPPAGMPDEDLALQMQEGCQGLLAQAGFVQYEVSAYARSGAQCRHNLNYWTYGDYLGVGAGAHGKLTLVPAASDATGVVRTVREREPRRYLARGATDAPVALPVAGRDLPFEFMMNGLRLVEGFTELLYESRTSRPWSSVAAPVSRLLERGLIENTAGRWRATTLGQRFLNDVVGEFLPEAIPSVRQKI